MRNYLFVVLDVARSLVGAYRAERSRNTNLRAAVRNVRDCGPQRNDSLTTHDDDFAGDVVDRHGRLGAVLFDGNGRKRIARFDLGNSGEGDSSAVGSVSTGGDNGSHVDLGRFCRGMWMRSDSDVGQTRRGRFYTIYVVIYHVTSIIFDR